MIIRKYGTFMPALLLVIVFTLIPLKTYASEIVDPYEVVLDDINEIYNLNLGYNKVNAEDMTLLQYEEIVTGLAKEQRLTLDYIASRINEQLFVDFIRGSQFITPYATTYDINGHVYYSSWAELFATYTCYTGTQTVGNPRNVVGRATNSYTSSSGREYVQQSWSYTTLDLGETLAITTTGYTVGLFGLGRIDNVIIYGEFYYQ